jgi:hypothetical protein
LLIISKKFSKNPFSNKPIAKKSSNITDHNNEVSEKLKEMYHIEYKYKFQSEEKMLKT